MDSGKFEAEDVTIFRLSEDNSYLKIERTLNVDLSPFKHFHFYVGEGICGACAFSRKPISVFNALDAPQFDRRVNEKLGIYPRSMVAAPIQFGKTLFGVLEILRFENQEPFEDEIKYLLGILGTFYGAHIDRIESTPHTKKNDKRKSTKDDSKSKRSKIIGTSSAIFLALDLCSRFSQTNDPILVRGETGTGKELVSRRIHEESKRAKEPFIAVNCAALPESLLESELFGHVSGAFSGAERDRQGLMVKAAGGTLFLDEIGEMSPMCQAKILRALETQEIMPVGSEETIDIDVRIISATNRDLWAESKNGTFRQDLYFRLSGHEFTLPPLRDRRGDILLLAEYFCRQVWEEKNKEQNETAPCPEFSEELEQALLQYDWPGNIRELRNSIRSALALCDLSIIQPSHLPQRVRSILSSTKENLNSIAKTEVEPLQETNEVHFRSKNPEQEKYLSILEKTAYVGTRRWNLAAAARKLQMPRMTLVYKLKQMKLYPQQCDYIINDNPN